MTATRLVIVILSIALAAACAKKAETPRPAADGEQAAKVADVYTCPMHPTVVQEKPGSCPICGMALVKRAPVKQEAQAGGALQSISLSPEQRVTGNVRTMPVVLDTHTGETITTGRVTFDERRAAQITAYTAGRVERMFVNFTGDSVTRGEAVASMYSPDLFSTQQEYLLALQNRERMRRAGFAGAHSASEDLVESTRRRLMIFGMTAAQVAQLEKSGKPIFATSVIAPVSGVVTKKLAVEQQYVAQGQPLLEVADLSRVWVEADVYEQQLGSVQVGQRVKITASALPGRELDGTVSFIEPVLAGATRTARVRIELPNPGLRLKPEMFVNVTLYGAPMAAHVMVPPTAVIDRGQKQFVWVETKPGTYEPREVTTGGRHGEQVVIASGLQEGDVIVVEGGFLLDSEAQLRGGGQ